MTGVSAGGAAGRHAATTSNTNANSAGVYLLRSLTGLTMVEGPPRDKNAAPDLRLRRPLTFGGLLDETVSIYRRWWTSFAALSALALVPYGVLLAMAGLAGAFVIGPAGPTVQPEVIIAAAVLGAVVGLGGSLFILLWGEAVTLMTDDLLRAEQRGYGNVYGRALGRFLPVLGASLLLVFGAVFMSLLGMLALVLTLGPVGMLIATIGVLVWWLNPGARRPWFKWLIILTTPFGLAIYYAVRWVLFTPAVLLEGRGPLASLRRSSQLVSGEWFRTAGVLIVVSLIVAVLVFLPSSLITLALTLTVGILADTVNPFLSILVNLGSVLGQILFGAIGYIAYTLLFLDLRNRREAADLAERVGRLESGVAPI